MPVQSSFLRQVALFANLPQEDLDQICRESQECRYSQGDILFTEGSLGQDAYVIRDGQIEIFKTVEGKRVQLAVRGPGEVIGEMALLEAAPRNASGQAMVDSLVIVIGHAQLDNLLNSSPAASRTMLTTITSRLRNTEILLRQSEKMAQLGTLMAGIAHELNNPAAAVGRSSSQLTASLANMQSAEKELHSFHLSADQLGALEGAIRDGAGHPSLLDTLARSDREAEIEEWLEDREIKEGWRLVSHLADLYDRPDSLEDIARDYPPASLPALLTWIVAVYDVYRLLDEIGVGAGRISEIVKALKSYVYLDQAPVQEIDLHEGLENSLIILRHKLKQGIEVVREYDRSIPPILAFGSELNQVWTNIIDNAIDAMDGKGRLTLRTRFDGLRVTVVIEDTGPGIPEEVQAKMFSPFYTTKPLGKGTGLGLNITYNIIQKHHGDIQVSSKPGQTCFSIHLPLNFERQAG